MKTKQISVSAVRAARSARNKLGCSPSEIARRDGIRKNCPFDVIALCGLAGITLVPGCAADWQTAAGAMELI